MNDERHVRACNGNRKMGHDDGTAKIGKVTNAAADAGYDGADVERCNDQPCLIRVCNNARSESRELSFLS